MNKKRNLILSLFLLPINLVSCNNNSTYDNDIVNLRKVEEITSYVEITSKNHLFNISRYDESMILVTKVGCEYCEKSIKELNTIINEEHILIYTVDINIYLEAYNDESNSSGEYAFLLPQINATPTFLFFKNGILKNYHVGSYQDNTTKTEILKYSTFSSFYSINTYNYDEKNEHYYIDYEEDHDFSGISTTSLDKKIESNDNFTIMFSWRKCGDCKEYYQYVLYPFMEKNKDKKIYIYEVDGYYMLKNYVDENNNPNQEYLSLWYEFSKKYNLTDYEYYDKYLNRSGVVPTLLNINNSNRTIDVFRNDYGIVFNDDNTISYSHSFNNEVTKIKSKTKVNNKDVTSSEYIKARKEIQDEALKIETKSSTNFLKNNL